MNNFEEFKLQIGTLGVKVTHGKSFEDLYKMAQELTGREEVDLNSPVLAGLWSHLEPEQVQLDWPEAEYKPESSMQKRVLLLAEKCVADLEGKFDVKNLKKHSDSLNHLFLHGKVGLMSMLFWIEKNYTDLKIRELGDLMEGFMEVIEEEFLTLLRTEQAESLCRSLSMNYDEKQSLKEVVHARLQPFSAMRGLYLESEIAKLSPMRWWVAHERFIPNLPLESKGA